MNRKLFGYKTFISQNSTIEFRGYLDTNKNVFELVEIIITNTSTKSSVKTVVDNFKLRALLNILDNQSAYDNFKIGKDGSTLFLEPQPENKVLHISISSKGKKESFPIGKYGYASLRASMELFCDELDKFLYKFQQDITEI